VSIVFDTSRKIFLPFESLLEDALFFFFGALSAIELFLRVIARHRAGGSAAAC
jgi:hypothetical protein